MPSVTIPAGTFQLTSCRSNPYVPSVIEKLRDDFALKSSPIVFVRITADRQKAEANNERCQGIQQSLVRRYHLLTKCVPLDRIVLALSRDSNSHANWLHYKYSGAEDAHPGRAAALCPELDPT